MDRDHYRILDVPKSATTEEIRRAYERASAACSPERVAMLDPEIRALALRKHARIQEAWAVLSNPERRRSHDAELPPPEEAKTPSPADSPRPSLHEFSPDDLIRRIEAGLDDFERAVSLADGAVRWRRGHADGYDRVMEGFKSVERTRIFVSTHDLLDPAHCGVALERFVEATRGRHMLLHRRHDLLVLAVLDASPEEDVRRLVRSFNEESPGADSRPLRLRDVRHASLLFLRRGELFLPGSVPFLPDLRHVSLAPAL